ncbi:MAG: DUF2628 domain-containing protein [Pseudomonadota bacterium]|nr:DUF2628 domain-containing protein [Pseudomonadota bacterium]
MKIYTVHIRPGEVSPQQKPVFVKEGFNALAFVFSLFWALYWRLWKPALLVIAFQVALVALRNHGMGVASIAALDLGFHLFFAYQANDWLRARLTRRGYVMADIAAGDTQLRAEQRYFERALAAAY